MGRPHRYRIARSLLSTLLLILPIAAVGEEAPRLYRQAGDEGRPILVPLTLVRSFDSPPLRDLGQGFGGELLLLGNSGDLHLIANGDSLSRRIPGADLEAEHWPEALCADGSDWLLLVRGGRALLRLGRRGEAKEEIPLPEDAFWRSVRADRAGRIWVTEEAGGEMVVLSRSGQVLQRWSLEARLPGYRGPLRAWCPDERGGVILAEGWPARLHHVNGAGNLLSSRELEPSGSALALAVDDEGALLIAVARDEGKLHLAWKPSPREYLIELGGHTWILAPEPTEPAPGER